MGIPPTAEPGDDASAAATSPGAAEQRTSAGQRTAAVSGVSGRFVAVRSLAVRTLARTVGSGRRPLPPAGRDAVVVLVFTAAAAWLTHGLWPDPASRALALNPEDQVLVEWFLAADVQIIFGDQGLVTDLLNAPDGVNMLANASSLGLALMLAPVTATLGAPVSFALLTAGSLAATAAAWYLLFTRTLGTHRAVAAVGGAFCGFAPAMVSHANSHWHMTAQWLVPAIVWSVVRLARAADRGHHRRVVTSALWLAGLVVAQYFIGAEVLYLTAVTLALFTLGYAATRPGYARRVAPGFAAGLVLAAGLATLALAYPLWVQFAGPGSVTGGLFSPHYYSVDLASWAAYSPLSIAGSDATAHLTTGPSEYNTFLGWPLVLAAVGAAWWARRSAAARAAVVAALVMALLSLGPELVVHQVRMQVPLPYTLLLDTPVIDGALPQRYAMAVVPLLALLLVLALGQAREQRGSPARWAVPALAAVALLPLTPAPLPTEQRGPVPEFVSGGHWRECTDPGGVLVPVPTPTPHNPEPMRWATAAGAEFGTPEGFFIGPYGRDGTAAMGTYQQPTSALLAQVADTGQVPAIGEEERRAAAADMRFWQADCMVLGPDQPHRNALRTTLTRLFDDPGRPIADAHVWPAG